MLPDLTDEKIEVQPTRIVEPSTPLDGVLPTGTVESEKTLVSTNKKFYRPRFVKYLK